MKWGSEWLVAAGLVCGLFLPTSLAAAPPEGADPITIDRAAREAVAWHPSIVEATARLDARTEEIDVAESGYLPQIDAGIGTGYDNVGQSRWRPRANVSVSQMLYDFGKVSSSVAAAEAGVEISEARVLLAVDSLIRETSYSIIEIQRTEALHRIALEQLESVREIGILVQHRFEEGAATKADTLQADARVQAAQATIEEIEAAHQRWQTALAHLLGRSQAPEVSSELPEGFKRFCEQAEPDWATIPAIQEVRAERDQALADLERSEAERLPTVSLGAGGATDIHDPFSGREEYNFGINVSTSLYNGGANRARVRSATYALGAADAAEARIRNEVSRTLSEAQRQVASFGRVLDTLALREASMRETGKLYRLQYLQMGTKTLVDLLNAEQELHQVRFDRANTRHDLRRLRIDCLVSSGNAREAFGLSGTAIGGTVL